MDYDIHSADSQFNKYYRDELDYLRALGREFATLNPDLAPHLEHPGNDPDVDRLFEGVAFLTGRIRQKLDDELPELTHSLLALLWPHYLRPVPSMAILEFAPVPNAVSQQILIEPGTPVASAPLDGTSCRFRTAYRVNMLPLSLVGAGLERTALGSQITLQFTHFPTSSLHNEPPDRLRLYLHGTRAVSSALYLWIFEHLERVTVRVSRGGQEVFTRSLDASAVHRVGLSDDASAIRGGDVDPGLRKDGGLDSRAKRDAPLLPYSDNAFPGYRLLQEYFHLPEKFLFFDITSLRSAFAIEKAESMSVALHFNERIKDIDHVSVENFKLNCTPIVNLFEHDADPIRIDHTRSEYRLQPSATERSHFELYSVDRVFGRAQGVSGQREYHAFESFAHMGRAGSEDQQLYYRLRSAISPAGNRQDSYLSFVDIQSEHVVPPSETVSIDLTCCNGRLADRLGVGTINRQTGTSPEYATFSNLTAPSAFSLPPLDPRLYWHLISNMSLNYSSLANTNALRAILSAYDFLAFTQREAARKRDLRLSGMNVRGVQSVDRLVHGLPVRGVRTNMDMRESCFAGEGDMYLFATVLSEFLGLFASVNSFHELTVKGEEQGRIYRWTPIKGQQPIV